MGVVMQIIHVEKKSVQAQYKSRLLVICEKALTFIAVAVVGSLYGLIMTIALGFI